MFGLLTVERQPLPGEAGSSIRNCASGTGNVATRKELFDQLVAALPDEWHRNSFIVTYFYAEPDGVGDDTANLPKPQTED